MDQDILQMAEFIIPKRREKLRDFIVPCQMSYSSFTDYVIFQRQVKY